MIVRPDGRVALTNSNGQVVERYEYDPYGTTTVLDAAGVPLALHPIDYANPAGYYHDHDFDDTIDAGDLADLMACVEDTPTDPRCVFVHDRNGDRRVDFVDLGVFAAFADFDSNGTAAPALFGRAQWPWLDVDGDGVIDMYDFYGLQTCYGSTGLACRKLFDADLNGFVDAQDVSAFAQVAGSPGTPTWRRQLLPSRYGNPFMWTGQRYDAATGQYHFWARTYSPHLGRWLQRDPLGYVDGINLYEYVSSAPLDWIDPLGLVGPESDLESVGTGAEDRLLGGQKPLPEDPPPPPPDSDGPGRGIEDLIADIEELGEDEESAEEGSDVGAAGAAAGTGAVGREVTKKGNKTYGPGAREHVSEPSKAKKNKHTNRHSSKNKQKKFGKKGNKNSKGAHNSNGGSGSVRAKARRAAEAARRAARKAARAAQKGGAIMIECIGKGPKILGPLVPWFECPKCGGHSWFCNCPQRI